jgi:Ca-activated chloride channel family protein
MRLPILAAGLLAASVLAPQEQASFRSTIDLVPVFATVTATDGSPARGLKKDDFVVLDNGKPQEIVSFSDEAQDISVAVVLDTSSSMAEALPRVFAAASAFLDNLLPADRAMVSSLFFQGPPFTSDKSRLRTSLSLLPPDPGSPIWSALDRSLSALNLESNRRVVVIYTDGKNRDLKGLGSVSPTASSILSRVESGAVMTYAIGFEGVPLSKDMKMIAKRSGGRATDLTRSDDLGAALTAVADELHHQYLLGFTPTVFDGKAHTIDVSVKPAGLSVRARQAYLARKGS